jgi:drug/metabolite transporter superfamily protein YnfA
MKNFFRSMSLTVGIVGQLLNFLWQRKLWWLIPMVVVLLVFGLLLVFASASGIGPFIYTLF